MWAKRWQRWCRGRSLRHFSEKVSELALRQLLLLESKPEKQRVRGILEKELPRWETSTDSTAKTLSLLSERGRPDIIDQIIELWRQEGQRSTFPCNVAISAHARRTSWQNALQIFHSMQLWRICRSTVSFNACAKALERGSVWQLAVDLFEKLTETLEPDALSYDIALNSLGRGHQWSLALQLYSEIPPEVADLVCLNSTISACSKGRAWHVAMTLFDAASIHFEPDVVTYGAAITAAGASSVSHAMKLLEEMSSRRIRRNTTVYNASIAACVAGSDWSLALRLFRDMPLLKLLPDAYTYNSGMSASSKGRAWETALQLFFDMTRRFLRPSAISYNAAIGALELQWSKAIHLYADMQDRCIQPDSYTFTALLNALEESGAWWLALDIFSTTRFQLQADVFSCSACIGALSAGRWDLALDLFAWMPVMRVRPNLVAYNAAISASAHGRHWQLAIHYVEVLRNDPLLPDPDAISYNSAIHACGSSGKEHAWRMFQEMQKERLVDAVTYNTILTGIYDADVNMDVKTAFLRTLSDQ